MSEQVVQVSRTYMKLTDKADTILMNCAECEPLLKLHRQLLEKHAYEIMKTFHMVAETVGKLPGHHRNQKILCTDDQGLQSILKNSLG